MRSASLLAVLALAVLGAGCTSTPTRDPPPAPVVFAPESTSDGAVVFLRGQAQGERLTIFVVARGTSELHGIAFRLVWDPDAIAFVDTAPGGAWSKQAMLLAKEGTPGQLAVVWTEKGDVPGIDVTEETVLGTIDFSVKGSKPTTLSFRSERSEVIDRKGKRIAVSWKGGMIPGR